VIRDLGLDRVTVSASVEADRLALRRILVTMGSIRFSIRANVPQGTDAKPPVRGTKVLDSGVAGTGPKV